MLVSQVAELCYLDSKCNTLELDKVSVVTEIVCFCLLRTDTQ